ncbi:MAG: hypothetical protein KDA79_16090 [Planctomycetaceae bacterium]|nr:hypothetical protein [Planctomycetaceae bacterium]
MNLRSFCRVLRLSPAVALTASLLLAAVPAIAEDQPADQPLTPAEAASTLKMPAGFRSTLFAGEPDVIQPIAFTLDDRGRLWVVESLTYPDWITDPAQTGHDRILIFEDENNDGRFDRRTVFYDQGTNLSGIAVGFGGVWLTAVPNLLFIPDQNADDRPDGPPEVLLDGWDLKARHNVVNGLTWGPDGWLYGCNGILSNSAVGKPGTPDEQRMRMNCGVWRYHPVRHEVEWVASGSTNPWGLDFDERGQILITNCVIHHLFHMIPGGHVRRMFGQDLTSSTFGLIESIADYLHWGGGRWQDSRGGQGIHHEAGGGHAHAGAMIYLGDNWPKKYYGSLFTCNIHGRRVNCDQFEQAGSGLKAIRADDVLFSADPWFRGLELKYGPDGGVYMTDWSDTGECHDYVNTQKGTGRIFKVTYGQPKPVKVNLQQQTDAELVQLQHHANLWYARHARRILQERAAAGTLERATTQLLRQQLAAAGTEPAVLRAMWTLYCTNGLTDEDLEQLLSHKFPYVRGWSIQLLLDDRQITTDQLSQLVELAGKNPSPVVRLYLASALQRLDHDARWQLAAPLLAHAEDAEDHNLPLMLWYGIEPLIAAEPGRAVALLPQVQIPLVRQYIARRLVQLEK